MKKEPTQERLAHQRGKGQGGAQERHDLVGVVHGQCSTAVEFACGPLLHEGLHFGGIAPRGPQHAHARRERHEDHNDAT